MAKRPRFIFTTLIAAVLICGAVSGTAVLLRQQEASKQAEMPSNSAASLEEAVGQAVIARESTYMRGETATEGHLILSTEEKNGTVKVYTLASYGAFGFENGIFTKISGSGTIPTVITFAKNDKGEYSLLEYKEPMDGAGYLESTKKMFPRQLHNRVLISSDEDYQILIKQQEAQAEAYLKSIGRNAEVRAGHVERKLAQINVEASNKLFAELTKYNSFLNDCPYWLGSREKVEEGIRYIYETSHSKTDDCYDLITFQKKKTDGTIVEQAKYKIVGSEPQLIE